MDNENFLAYKVYVKISVVLKKLLFSNCLLGNLNLFCGVELDGDNQTFVDGNKIQYCISALLFFCYEPKKFCFLETPLKLHFIGKTDFWICGLFDFIVNYNSLPPETHVMFTVFVQKAWNCPECIGFGIFPVFAWPQYNPKLLPVYNFGVYYVKLFQSRKLPKSYLGPKYVKPLINKNNLRSDKGGLKWAFTTCSLESLAKNLLEFFFKFKNGDEFYTKKSPSDEGNEAWLKIEALEIREKLSARIASLDLNVLDSSEQEIDEQNRNRMRLLANLSPTEELSNEDKQFWLKHLVSSKNASLARFTTCVDWTDSKLFEEYLSRVEVWDVDSQSCSVKYIRVCHALYSLKHFSHLLKTKNFPKCSFEKLMHLYVKKFLDPLKYEDLKLVTLQLIRCCCFDDSMILFNFIVEKCLLNWKLANSIYWKLKVLGNELLLSNYVSRLENHSESGVTFMQRIKIQEVLTSKLNEMLAKLQEVPTRNRDDILNDYLNQIQDFKDITTLPIFPELKFKGITRKVKIFSSANTPILLEFVKTVVPETTDNVLKTPDSYAENLRVIYKRGDDLRQDELCLQMLQILDDLMVESGFERVLKLYRTIPLSSSDGFIEYVPDSVDLAEILNVSGISEYLKEKCLDPENFKQALCNYYRSCACYCVANYVFGITDRHNNNIMVNRQGYLFHIDFGFMFGNSSNRLLPPEAPVKLSERMVSPINEYGLYEVFIAYCREVFLLMRHNADIFVILILLMGNVSTVTWNEDYRAKFIESRLGLNPRIQDDEKVWCVFKNYLEKSQLHIGNRVKDAVHDFQTYWVKTST